MRYKYIDEYIGNLIKEKRIEKNYSMQEICDKVGIKSRQAYRTYENAIASIPFDKYKKICSILDLDYEKVFNDASEYMIKMDKENNK